MIAFEAGFVAVGALLIMGKRIGAPDHHHGVMLGAAAGVLFGVSDVAIKAITGLVGDGPARRAAEPVDARRASPPRSPPSTPPRKGLQEGEAVPVIALTGAAANVSGIAGGIIVFGDPLPGNALGIVLQARRLRARDRRRRAHAGAGARRRALRAAASRTELYAAYKPPPRSSAAADGCCAASTGSTVVRRGVSGRGECAMATTGQPATGATATLQELAKRHLWMHFTRMGAYADADVPIIVRGEGCYVWDEHGNRYLDGLSSLFCVEPRPRPRRHRPGRRRPGARARLLLDLVLRAPAGDRAGGEDRLARPRRPQPRLLHERRQRGRRVGAEARARLPQGSPATRTRRRSSRARSPTTAPRSARSPRPASRRCARRSSRSPPAAATCPTRTSTACPRASTRHRSRRRCATASCSRARRPSPP